MTQNLPAVATIDQLERMAQSIVKSGLFGVKSIDQAVTLMLVAQAEGLHPASAARDYHIVQGRPTLKADAMLARFQQAGGKVEWQEYTDSKVCGAFSHPACPKPVSIEWTFEMAKKIGLTNKDNWRNYPRAMLRARVISEGVRTCYPAIATGIYTQEEVQDFAPEKDITPTAGALAALPVNVQEVVIETAQEVKALLANDQTEDAYAMWQNSNFDADQQVAFWSQLDSKQRGVLDRMREAEKAQEKGVISPARHKRLEAMIKDAKLDREGLKNWCITQFDKHHFTELSRDECDRLEAHIAEILTAPAPKDSSERLPSQSATGLQDAGATLCIDEKQEGELIDLLEAAGISIKEFVTFAKIPALAKLQAARYQGAKKWIQDNKRGA